MRGKLVIGNLLVVGQLFEQVSLEAIGSVLDGHRDVVRLIHRQLACFTIRVESICFQDEGSRHSVRRNEAHWVIVDGMNKLRRGKIRVEPLQMGFL